MGKRRHAKVDSSSRKRAKITSLTSEKKTSSTKVDVRTQIVKNKYPFALNTSAQVSVRSNLEFGKNVGKVLTVLSLFVEGCFGAYLNMELASFSGVICHALLSREIHSIDDKAMAFHVRGVELVFEEREFGLISELALGDIDVVDQRFKTVLLKRKAKDLITFRQKYFENKSPILNIDIVKAFTSPKEWSDEDAVMMANLYFVAGCLLEHTSLRHIPDHIIDMTDYSAYFNDYPWGSLAYNKLFKSLSTAISKRERQFQEVAKLRKAKKDPTAKKVNKDKKEKKKNKKVSYQLFGLPHVFQTWLLEMWDATSIFYVKLKNVGIPRVLAWRSTEHTPTLEAANKLFIDGYPPKSTPIEATDVEKQSGWYKKILRKLEGVCDGDDGKDDDKYLEDKKSLDGDGGEDDGDSSENPNQFEFIPHVQEKKSVYTELKAMFIAHEELCTKKFSQLRDGMEVLCTRVSRLEDDVSYLKSTRTVNDDEHCREPDGEGDEHRHDRNEEPTTVVHCLSIVPYVGLDSFLRHVCGLGKDDDSDECVEKHVPLVIEPISVCHVDETPVRIYKRTKNQSRFLCSPFTDPFRRMKDKKGTEEPVERLDYVPKDILEEYNMWLKNTASDVLHPIPGNSVLKSTTNWWRELERSRMLVENSYINAWFWMLREFYWFDRPDWTTVDADFVGNLGQSNMVIGWDIPNGWGSAPYFIDKIIGEKASLFRPWNEVRRVLVPICHNVHWFLGVLELEEMHMYCYDSLYANSRVWGMEDFLKQRLQMVHKLMQLAGYKGKCCKKSITFSRVLDVPQQRRDSIDCGVFTCEFARFLCEYCVTDHKKRQLWWFKGADGQQFRKRIAIELYKGHLLDNLPQRA